MLFGSNETYPVWRLVGSGTETVITTFKALGNAADGKADIAKKVKDELTSPPFGEIDCVQSTERYGLTSPQGEIKRHLRLNVRHCLDGR